MTTNFNSLDEFYPFYLTQHANPWCRYCHYLGSTLVLIGLYVCISTGNLAGLLLLPVVGYGCAWIGHFVFEHNKPATFGHPFYSFISDWIMYRDWLLTPFRSKATGG